ncbi:hypothetical protein PMAYCL1PPCAC_01994, partial [Pristionchus mayeri]
SRRIVETSTYESLLQKADDVLTSFFENPANDVKAKVTLHALETERILESELNSSRGTPLRSILCGMLESVEIAGYWIAEREKESDVQERVDIGEFESSPSALDRDEDLSNERNIMKGREGVENDEKPPKNLQTENLVEVKEEEKSGDSCSSESNDETEGAWSDEESEDEEEE